MALGSVNWVILITFNILMTLNPKKDICIGRQRCGKKWILPNDVYLFIFDIKNIAENKSVLVEYVLQQALSSKCDLR